MSTSSHKSLSPHNQNIIDKLTNDLPNPLVTGHNLLSVESEPWYMKDALVGISLRSSEVPCKVVQISFPAQFSTTVETGIELPISQYRAGDQDVVTLGRL